MRNPISQLNFLFFSTLMAILIWMASPSVKGSESKEFPFPSYEARYSISWHGVSAGESLHKFRQLNNGKYYFESKTSPHVTLLPYRHFESSTFTYEKNAILPEHYQCNIQEGKRRKIGDIYFDWKNKSASNNKKEEPFSTSLIEGMQDKITQTLSVRAALKKGKANLSYQVVELDKVKDYRFVVLGAERLQTKIGLLDTIKLKHTSKKGYETFMWLAINHDYIPVKMQQIRSKKIVASGTILSLSPQKGAN